MIDGVEYRDSSELSVSDSNNLIQISENTISDYNIVSKNLSNGVLNFIDFDEQYYYYRQYAFDDNESQMSLRGIDTDQDLFNKNVQIGKNKDGSTFLYTEGYDPNPQSFLTSTNSSTSRIIGNDDRKQVEDTTQWPYWYRQEADGYWSHKRGHSPVERVDYSGNLIIDPYTANRGNYTNFIGYFAVSPWGNMYVE